MIGTGRGLLRNVGENRIEQFGLDRAEQLLSGSLAIDHNERWLLGNTEAQKHLARIVADLREAQAVLVDESLEVGVGSCPRNTNKLDLSGPSDCCFLDRGSFTIAGGSSGCPKPKRQGLANIGRPIEHPAAD